jgi:hypothetical protein
MAVVVPPTVLGGYLGGLNTGRISKEAVKRFAGAIITVTGVMLVVQGVGVAVRKSSSEIPSLLVDETEYDGWFDYDYDDKPDDESVDLSAHPTGPDGFQNAPVTPRPGEQYPMKE